MFHLGHCRPADTTQHPESTPCSTRMAKVRSRHLPIAAPAPPDLLKIKSKIQCQSSGDFAASALEVTVSPGCFPPHQLCYSGPLPLFTGQTYVARGAEGAVIYLASLARTRRGEQSPTTLPRLAFAEHTVSPFFRFPPCCKLVSLSSPGPPSPPWHAWVAARWGLAQFSRRA